MAKTPWAAFSHLQPKNTVSCTCLTSAFMAPMRAKSLSTFVVGLLALWRKALSLRVSQMFVPVFSALLAE